MLWSSANVTAILENWTKKRKGVHYCTMDEQGKARILQDTQAELGIQLTDEELIGFRIKQFPVSYLLLWFSFEESPIEDLRWGGRLFAAAGDTLAHVREMADEEPGRVWTLTDNDEEGGFTVSHGFSTFSAKGYFITKVEIPRTDVTFVTVPAGSDNWDV